MSYHYKLPSDDGSSDWYGCIVHDRLSYLVSNKPSAQDAAMLWAKYFHKRIPGSQPTVIHRTKVDGATRDYEEFLELLKNPPSQKADNYQVYYSYVEKDSFWEELEELLIS